MLVGDQAQLEPVHKKEVVDTVAIQTQISRKEIKRSDFERVFASDYGAEAGRQLTQQYRMLAPIGRIDMSLPVQFMLGSDLLNDRPIRSTPLVSIGSIGRLMSWYARVLIFRPIWTAV